MDESANPTSPDPEPPTPEVVQLLKLLEIQSATRRGQLAERPGLLRGASFKYGSLIAIVVFALASVAIMEWMVSQLPRPERVAPTAGVQAGETPGK